MAAAVETLSNSVLHGNLTPFSDADVVELMQRLETCKRQLSALDSRLIIEAANRSLPETSGAGELVPFLRQTLGLSRYDASVRVKITRQCGEFFNPRVICVRLRWRRPPKRLRQATSRVIMFATSST
ncbi:hypothetical protein [Nocardia sp. NPDC059239]|uniref:hypothetical protein n=1 Tax=unclassified Nocardia TaxID=2637762 RepID=UPI0036B90EA2